MFLNLINLPANGANGIFVVFQEINVRQKRDRPYLGSIGTKRSEAFQPLYNFNKTIS